MPGNSKDPTAGRLIRVHQLCFWYGARGRAERINRSQWRQMLFETRTTDVVIQTRFRLSTYPAPAWARGKASSVESLFLTVENRSEHHFPGWHQPLDRQRR